MPQSRANGFCIIFFAEKHKAITKMWQSWIEFRYYADLIILRKGVVNITYSKTTVVCELPRTTNSLGFLGKFLMDLQVW